MAGKTNQAFDPKEFLAKIGEGKTLGMCRRPFSKRLWVGTL